MLILSGYFENPSNHRIPIQITIRPCDLCRVNYVYRIILLNILLPTNPSATMKDDVNLVCDECFSPLEGYSDCKFCLIRHCEETFQTSSNEEIDTILKETHSHISDSRQILEYVPLTNFNVMEQIGEGGFSKVFKAEWIKGGIIDSFDSWDPKTKSWRRERPHPYVALKKCDSWRIFINEVSHHFKS